MTQHDTHQPHPDIPDDISEDRRELLALIQALSLSDQPEPVSPSPDTPPENVIIHISC